MVIVQTLIIHDMHCLLQLGCDSNRKGGGGLEEYVKNALLLYQKAPPGALTLLPQEAGGGALEGRVRSYVGLDLTARWETSQDTTARDLYSKLLCNGAGNTPLLLASTTPAAAPTPTAPLSPATPTPTSGAVTGMCVGGGGGGEGVEW